jgi:hypothetical protein
VFELLLVVIGVLALVMLLLIGRSRRSSGDPSSSVQDFTRALTAMEPGGAGHADDGSSGDADPAEAPAEDSPDGRDRSSR